MKTDSADRQKPAKTDRRVIRTRAAIHEAFITLVSEMRYDKITITALAQRANIDRKTFYTHYASIDELLEDIIRQRLHNSIGALDLTDFYGNPDAFAKALLSAFEAALPLSVDERRSALGNVPVDKILTYWTEAAKESIVSQAGPLPADAQRRIDVLLDFYLGGIFNAYVRWLKCKSELPLETALGLLSEGIANGLSGLMGVQSDLPRRV